MTENYEVMEDTMEAAEEIVTKSGSGKGWLVVAAVGVAALVGGAMYKKHKKAKKEYGVIDVPAEKMESENVEEVSEDEE